MGIVQNIQPRAATQIPEPLLARFLFADTRMAWLWLIVRLYAGYEWLDAGWRKLTGYTLLGAKVGNPWVFSSTTGAPIEGFVRGALAKAGGESPSVTGWYAWFLQHPVQPYPAVWAYLITFGYDQHEPAARFPGPVPRPGVARRWVLRR